MNVPGGNPRLKTLVHRILREAVNIIEDLDVTPEEFWQGVNNFNTLGARQEAGLLAAGLGLEHYLDLLLDAKDAEARLSGGTPRTLEGPLYVAGAPLVSDGSEARLDDDFAYATRDELIASIAFSDDSSRATAHGVTGRFAEIDFDFTLQVSVVLQDQGRKARARALEG